VEEIREAEREEEGVAGEEKRGSKPDPFELFWESYPRKMGKGNAEKAWRRRKCGAIVPQILTTLEAAKVSHDWTKEGGQFVPHPATWLNRHGWKDEYPPARARPGAMPQREALQLPIVDL